MPASEIPPTKFHDTWMPFVARRFLRHLLAFGVTFVVGLSPLLGRVRIPGFVSLLDVYPVNIRDTAIPFAAFLMSICAVAIQFYSAEKIDARLLRRWFQLGFVAEFILVLALYSAMTVFVVAVPFEGADRTARYVVGSQQRSDCACNGKNITECVGVELTFNPAQVEGCFPYDEIQLRKLMVTLPYLCVMSVFGLLVGAIILQQSRFTRVKAQRPVRG